MLVKTNIKWLVVLFLVVTIFCFGCTSMKSNGQWLKGIREHEEQKRELQRQVMKIPNNYDANYMLGISYIADERAFSILSEGRKHDFLHKAIFYLEKAILIRPESAEAHLALGEVLGNEKVNDGFGAIRHTIIAKKLFERKNSIEGVELAKENMEIFSKEFFSFYLLGFADIQIPEPS